MISRADNDPGSFGHGGDGPDWTLRNLWCDELDEAVT